MAIFWFYWSGVGPRPPLWTTYLVSELKQEIPKQMKMEQQQSGIFQTWAQYGCKVEGISMTRNILRFSNSRTILFPIWNCDIPLPGIGERWARDKDTPEEGIKPEVRTQARGTVHLKTVQVCDGAWCSSFCVVLFLKNTSTGPNICGFLAGLSTGIWLIIFPLD